jgi:hypothetical protein
LTQRQRMIVAVATAVVAITRWLALSRTLWDWDEAQFILGMRHFDIAAHHPHPPGFPLFIAAGKAMQWIGFDEFHALQALSFIAAVLIVPAMTSFALAAGADFLTSLLASLILAFFPNVWFYGGTALSDVPSMTLIVLAIALLLRERTLYAGAIVLGIAAGIRPQNLLIAAAPFAIALWRYRRRAVGPAFVTAAIVVISYSAAAWATGGWDVFLDALRRHQAYLARVDAWTNPTRPPLTHLFDDFFIRPYRAPVINVLTTLFVAISLLRGAMGALAAVPVGGQAPRLSAGIDRRGRLSPDRTMQRRLSPHGIVLAAFAPFCLAAWLMLDHFSVSRFSVGYAPLFAILAADGLLGQRTTDSGQQKPRWFAVRCLLSAVYITLMIVWTWPALTVVRTTISPPVAAANWLRAAHATEVIVDPRMAAFGDALLPEMTRRSGVWSALPGDYLLTDVPGAITFRRPHGTLWSLARQRYFEASVSPAQSPFAFGEGWYGRESSGGEVWRWMGQHSRTRIVERCTSLTFDFYAPLADATISIAIDGKVIDRFKPPAAEFMRTYMLMSAPRGATIAPRELAIETDRVARNTNDARELGLRLKGLECGRPTT